MASGFRCNGVIARQTAGQRLSDRWLLAKRGYEFEASKALVADGSYFAGWRWMTSRNMNKPDERLQKWLAHEYWKKPAELLS